MKKRKAKKKMAEYGRGMCERLWCELGGGLPLGREQNSVEAMCASGKALWSVICGQSVLASDEVVGEELQQAAEHLREGLSLYKPWDEECHKIWIKKSKLNTQQQNFVYKVGKMLEICSEQAWEIFQLFLQYEYRGSSSQLVIAASSDREETLLLYQVLNFHLSDPLHLLSCRRHILASDASHPYQNLFKEFIDNVLDTDRSLGTKLVSQLKLLKSKDSGAIKGPPSSDLPPNASHAKIAYRLSAIRHQLATLLIYHGSPGRPCPPHSVSILLQLAQGSGLGRDNLENDTTVEQLSYGLQLESIDAFHSFLLTLVINADSDPRSHPLCESEWVNKLNPLIFSLGAKPWHYPPILAWAILQGRRVASESGYAEESVKYSRLAQRAIKGNVFQYMQSALKISAFETDHLLFVIGASVTYSLLCIVGSCLDFEKLGLTAQAENLAKVCLAFDPPSQLFWNEEGGGASVLLPSALEDFPYNSHSLLDIATALASASEFSAGKVVQLIKDMESFTWPLMEITLSGVSISGNQCVSTETLQLFPGLLIPAGSHGTIISGSLIEPPLIICWQITTNGWQTLLSAFKTLQTKIESGITAEKWILEIVISALHLISSIVRSNPSHLGLFQHLQETSKQLLMSVSQVLKPNYDLICSLLELFAEVAKSNSEAVWNDLDGCPLLPSLPLKTLAKRQGSNLLQSYCAGNIRSLICGEEAASGTFSVLKHLCCLVESAVKTGISHSSVRGSLIFIVKEIVPVMLQWRYCSAAERVAVVEGTFSVLHHSLEVGCIDNELKEVIVSELSSTVGAAGVTLRYVLEGGANLEAALDQPAEWPHSSHASKLTRIAQLALSITHRLLGQFINWSKGSGKNLNEYFLGGSLNQNTTFRIISSANVNPRPLHLALTVAHFVHHRLNPRLPYLALQTLTRLAKELGVPLVACLGTEAEGVRDCLLTRLDSSTEDLWVKVALLHLLTASTKHQPGLIRLFLTPPATLLDTVVSLMEIHKECKNEASSELMSALVEMTASLWEGNFAIATLHLRKKVEFWDGLSFCICRKSPGSVKDDIIGNIFRIYSLEYFSAQVKDCDRLDLTVQNFISGNEENFSCWFKYIFVTSVTKKTNLANSEVNSEDDDDDGDKKSTLLLRSSCEFLVVLLTRSNMSLKDKQKIFLGERILEGLLTIFEYGNYMLQSLQIMLCEIQATLVHHCGNVLANSNSYVSSLAHVLHCLPSAVMQTSAKCQIPILAATIKMLLNITNNKVAEEFASSAVNTAAFLVEQHCSLAGSCNQVDANTSFECSSPAALALSCVLLRQCLLYSPSNKVQSLLEQSHLVYSLIQAASKQTKDANAGVVIEILRLLSLLARQKCLLSDLTTSTLAISVSLVLSSQTKLDTHILSELLWCTVWCLKREGAAGLKGAVNLVAVHLPAITFALVSSDTQPDVALSAASLAATLAPHHQLWRVIHPQCFEQLMTATACCIHHTTVMLHLTETLERETSREIQDLKTASENVSASSLSPSTISLINQLLQILNTCLHAVRYLSPDIVDLLCLPGIDLSPWNTSLIQPTCRKLSSKRPSTLPNLATLAEILDLYHIFAPKVESKTQSPTHCLNLGLLTQCAEEALVLLLSYATVFLMSPESQPREARDIRTFIDDETNSFFSHWKGRKIVTTSPLLPSSPGVTSDNLPFLMLCRQIVASLCSSKKS